MKRFVRKFLTVTYHHMHIDIRTHHYELTEEMSDHIDKKLQPLKKFLPGIDRAYVILSMDTHHRSGEVATAEVSLCIAGNREPALFAKETAASLVEALDVVIPKLKAQIEDFKDKNGQNFDTLRAARGK